MFKFYCTLLPVLATSCLYYAHCSNISKTEIRNALEGSILHLACAQGQSINVTSARYGQWSENSSCSQHQYKESVCYKIITKLIVDRCNGQEICEINVGSQALGDPCPQRTFKEAEVEFYCYRGEQMNPKIDHLTTRALYRKKKSVTKRSRKHAKIVAKKTTKKATRQSTKKPKKSKRKM